MRRGALIAALVLGAWAHPTLAQESGSCPCSFDFSSVDEIIEQRIDEGYLDGANIRLVLDGCVVHERAYGTFTLDRVVSLASATKWFAAAEFMTLVDAGLIDLDDRVGDYLPECGPDKAPITMRQLWSHTSGLPHEADCLSDCTISLADCAAQICELPMAGTPGGQLIYGGPAMHATEILTGTAPRTMRISVRD